MGHPFGREKPVKKTGTKSRASKKKRAERLSKADHRALDRYTYVKEGQKLRREDPDLSLRGAFRALKEKYENGELDVQKFPSRATFCRRMKEAREIRAEEDRPVTVADLADKRRQGRPSKEWHPDVVDCFESMVLAQQHPSIPLLHEDLEAWCNDQEPPLPAPSEWMVRKRYEGIDLAELSAARHGRRAARADATTKMAIPSEFPHQAWTLDEMDSPNWCKAVHPVSGKLVSVRPKVVLNAENYSRPIVSYQVCEPFKGGSTTVSFDSEDVLGTYFSGIFSELASEECRQFTGFVPWDVRLDGAPQHNVLKALLRKHRGDGADMEPGAPWKRGNIERIVGRFDDLLAGTKGHAGSVIPADRVKEHQKAARSKAAATTDRVRRKVVVEVEDLPTVEEFREILGEAVGRYNRTEHRMLGMSPEVSYHNNLRKKLLRPMHDALFMLDTVVLTVGSHIEHRNVAFSARLPSGPIPKGERVDCRPDPLRRGLFVDYGGEIYFAKPAGQHAKELAPAQVVREEKSLTAEYSDAAESALGRQVDEQHGSGGKHRKQVVDPVADKDKEDVDVEPAASTPTGRSDSANEQGDQAEAASSENKEDAGERRAAVPETPTRKKKLPKGLVKSRNPNIRLVK